MKRIVSAVAVLAVVSSALAFTSKKNSQFCGSLDQNDGCAVISGKQLTDAGHGSATYFIYNAWNGQASDCLSTRCATQTTLFNEQ